MGFLSTFNLLSVYYAIFTFFFYYHSFYNMYIPTQNYNDVSLYRIRILHFFFQIQYKVLLGTLRYFCNSKYYSRLVFYLCYRSLWIEKTILNCNYPISSDITVAIVLWFMSSCHKYYTTIWVRLVIKMFALRLTYYQFIYYYK